MLQFKLFQRWRHVFDQIVSVSKAVKDRLETEGIRPVEVFHNGVLERPIRPALSEPPTVAFAGRLAKEKGIDTLLYA